VWNRADCGHLTCRFITRFISLGMMVMQFLRPGAVGTCIVINREFFLNIGGFDEAVVDGEDWELTHRAVKLGAKFRVFRLPKLWISGRRFEKEGLWNMTTWFVKFSIMNMHKGSIKEKVFDYKMGGSEFVNQRSTQGESKVSE
jgi:predicted glycosyltransferase involved in capsule biosynthesis